MKPWPSALLAADTQAVRNIAACFGIVAVLWGLAVMLCRERVKQHLNERGFKPARIWWRPLASSRVCGRFQVRYQDAGGIVQQARCATEWLGREVFWEADGNT